jgi:tRNA-2-methylthio-N6-dimethylallyladenosine synthase
MNTVKKMSKKVYIETYGCQMNVADSEVVVSILSDAGYIATENIDDAGLILINTCSIRDNAEQRIWGRLKAISHLKKRKNDLRIGVIGCMAERL